MKPQTLRNLENLTALWRRMGSLQSRLSSGAVFERSVSWPHRSWFAPGTRLDPIDLEELAPLLLAGGGVFPVWGGGENTLAEWLSGAGCRVASKLTAMRLPEVEGEWHGSLDLAFERVVDPQAADVWTRTAAESFGYAIDGGVVRGLLNDQDIDLFIAGPPQGPTIGTGLLFETDGVVGIHMMGVSPEHRRGGVARHIMHELLSCAAQRSPREITLQASVMGGGLYRSLGFEPQLEIWNYEVGPSS